jgi:uncharacterized membrane-anchored protein YhcB (DUF1043 family)
MEWYWWVLIAIGVVIIGYIKIRVGKKMLENMRKRREEKERRMEEDE